MKVKSLSHVRLLATPWTAAHQAPLSMGFSRQECWSGVPLPSLAYSLRGPNFFFLNSIFINTKVMQFKKSVKNRSSSFQRTFLSVPQQYACYSWKCWSLHSFELSVPLTSGPPQAIPSFLTNYPFTWLPSNYSFSL